MTPDRKRWPRAEAEVVAGELLGDLGMCCERIAVGGSVRRKKDTVGDLELLFIPFWRIKKDPSDLFSQADVNLADEAIEGLVKRGVLALRPNTRGITTYGPKNKLMVHCASGIPVDLFSTSLENWNVSLVIRTGGKDTNLRLTTGAQRMGRKLHAYGSGVEILETGEILFCKSERDVFDLCAVPYLDPEDRA